jgi:hypothetical protein|tara:strand:+ start:1132 stop:1353 length:222 start_codon:yes stop_codon:yes gene_type:complete
MENRKGTSDYRLYDLIPGIGLFIYDHGIRNIKNPKPKDFFNLATMQIYHFISSDLTLNLTFGWSVLEKVVKSM